MLSSLLFLRPDAGYGLLMVAPQEHSGGSASKILRNRRGPGRPHVSIELRFVFSSLTGFGWPQRSARPGPVRQRPIILHPVLAAIRNVGGGPVTLKAETGATILYSDARIRGLLRAALNMPCRYERGKLRPIGRRKGHSGQRPVSSHLFVSGGAIGWIAETLLSGTPGSDERDRTHFFVACEYDTTPDSMLINALVEA